MKKRLIVLAMVLTMAISQGGIAWATELEFENTDMQVIEKVNPAQVNIIRPLEKIVTDKNLFISAQIFDGARARLSVFRKIYPNEFSIGFNNIRNIDTPYLSQELIYESPLIERQEESVFYVEKTTGSAIEGKAKDSSDSIAKGVDPESTEELLLVDKLGEIFGVTSSTDMKTFDEDGEGDVLFYYKKLENVKPGAYRIQFEVFGENEDDTYFIEKQVEVKNLSLTVQGANDIKKAVLEILSKSFTGLMSR